MSVDLLPMDPKQLGDHLLQLRQEQERLFSRLQRGELQSRRLARSVWRVQEDERRRLARELHDGLGQTLTAIRHRIEQIAPHGTPPAAVEEALQLCDLAISETRALARNLRPQILDDLGLQAALQWLTRTAAVDGGPQISLDASGLDNVLDGELRTLVFRVAQEALNNALKHAQAQTIVLRLFERARVLHILVVDDGVGCDTAAALAQGSQGLSSGLSSMRERVRLFGGQLQMISAPGEGAQIRISLPLVDTDPASSAS
jgi:signal transduction histidine kinase